MTDTLLLGLAFAGLIGFVMWRAGVRPPPWREILAYEALGLALWIILRTSRVFDPGTSAFVGFVAAAIVLELWRRLAHRPSDRGV